MIEVKIPKIAESVSEAYLSQWYKKNGDVVTAEMPILSLETDKISFEVKAPAQGSLQILVPVGQTVKIGTVVAHIAENQSIPTSTTPIKQESMVTPVAEAKNTETKTTTKPSEVPLPPSTHPQIIAPSALQLIQKYGLQMERITGTGPNARITKGDVLSYLEANPQEKPTTPAILEKPSILSIPSAALQEPIRNKEPSPPAIPADIFTKTTHFPEEITRKAMSPIRAKIADHLLHAKHSTAMLTTFNEVDMSRIIELRSQYKETFQQKYKTSLGFMPFFIKATIVALQEYPQLNAYLEDKEIVYHNYYHIGIAVGSERGLVVPVIRHADRLSFVELEQIIQAYIEKVKQNKLTLQDLAGGTFTISNGGVYGSLLSTPILNTPQTGILGMHKIQDRPVAINGQVVIRPMMYLAMSYDHRMIDGRESVNFLKRIKECLENPERMMMAI